MPHVSGSKTSPPKDPISMSQQHAPETKEKVAGDGENAHAPSASNSAASPAPSAWPTSRVELAMCEIPSLSQKRGSH